MSFSQCVDYIRSDYYRITGRRGDSLLRMFFAGILDVGFRFLFWWRLSKCTNPLVGGGVSRLMYRLVGQMAHIDIQRDTEMGYGILIAHGGPVVINSSAVIGDNVDIFQNATIGSSFFHAAHIGNNVYIGPNVCIVEDVKIGDGVTIGAGAVVVKDVEAGMTVAGNPARVISHKEPGRLVWRRWNKEWNKHK